MRSLPRYTEGFAQHMDSTLPRLTSRFQVGWHESTILSLLHIAEAKEGPGGSKVGQHGFIKSIHCTGHSLGSDQCKDCMQHWQQSGPQRSPPHAQGGIQVLEQREGTACNQ